MGEDLEQEGRMAVRTPMQWSAGPQRRLLHGPRATASSAGRPRAATDPSTSTSPTSAVTPTRCGPSCTRSSRAYRSCPELGWGEFRAARPAGPLGPRPLLHHRRRLRGGAAQPGRPSRSRPVSAGGRPRVDLVDLLGSGRHGDRRRRGPRRHPRGVRLPLAAGPRRGAAAPALSLLTSPREAVATTVAPCAPAPPSWPSPWPPPSPSRAARATVATRAADPGVPGAGARRRARPAGHQPRRHLHPRGDGAAQQGGRRLGGQGHRPVHPAVVQGHAQRDHPRGDRHGGRHRGRAGRLHEVLHAGLRQDRPQATTAPPTRPSCSTSRPGVTSLSTRPPTPRRAPRQRDGSDVLDTFTGTVPGSAVADLFVIGDKSGTFDITYGVTDTDHELRTVAPQGTLLRRLDRDLLAPPQRLAEPVAITRP